MFIRDIIDEAIESNRISAAMRNVLIDFRSREHNCHHGNRFRMSDIMEIACERRELESRLIAAYPEFA